MNEPFICANCHKEVLPLTMGVRNHCPHCLCSLHTDIFPGDNANSCHGLMRPVGVLKNEDGEMLLLHKCDQCGKTSRAKITLDDNYNEVLKLI